MQIGKALRRLSFFHMEPAAVGAESAACGRFSEEDLYKVDFKYYKAKQRPPDLSAAVDANSESAFQWSTCEIGENDEGLKETLKAFTAGGLHHWTHSCLFEYPERPNVTNLEKLPAFMKERHSKVILDDELRKKLRWATLGYHHDWDTKVYNYEHFSRFPPQLAKCAALLVEKAADHEHKFQAEAAIVNYYPLGTTLAGHVDRSEEDQTAPLVSISLGCSCVFLIGGPSRTVRPSAMLLRHGDVVLMTGSARQAYHGVPRVFAEKALDQPGAYALEGECEGDFCRKYLSKHRININIRQVHEPHVRR